MSKLIVEIPDQLHSQLRKAAALNERTLRDILMDLVQDYLARQRDAKSLRNTGLCGTWKDDRTADEIIMDIKKHRSWFAKGKKDGQIRP